MPKNRGGDRNTLPLYHNDSTVVYYSKQLLLATMLCKTHRSYRSPTNTTCRPYNIIFGCRKTLFYSSSRKIKLSCRRDQPVRSVS